MIFFISNFFLTCTIKFALYYTGRNEITEYIRNGFIYRLLHIHFHVRNAEKIIRYVLNMKLVKLIINKKIKILPLD